MKIAIPTPCLVVLIGTSGSGKSTFARKHFLETEVLSSDYCRGLVSDDQNNQAATNDAFEVLHFVAAKRLAAKRLTVVDATNVQPESRRPLVELARRFHLFPVAIVLKTPTKVCIARNEQRSDRNFGAHVVHRQYADLKRSVAKLDREGFRHVWTIETEEQLSAVEIVRQPLWTDRQHEAGPFDIIGDVHGCFEELIELLGKLGYRVTAGPDGYDAEPPAGRKLVFVGDLVDRGPAIPQTLKLAMRMVAKQAAICVPGNHDVKLLKWLHGRDVSITHGLKDSIEQISREPASFRQEATKFLEGLVSHFVLDGGRLVVAHAGLKEELQGRSSAAVRDFALYGETTGETDEYGLPVRLNWAADYRGNATVVYGHTPVAMPDWLNRTINIDTGCVFGGSLTALRYPERELVSVPANRTYYQSLKPFLGAKPLAAEAQQVSAQQAQDDVLDLEDVAGKRIIHTRLRRSIVVREENSIAALEVMSRFAINPKWLIYLPPTMSPCETSQRDAHLEHPAEALAYFRNAGINKVVCEEKHMGSRAVVVLCRDEVAAARHFGVTGEGLGACFTRTGRRFFQSLDLEREFLTRLRDAISSSGIWTELQTEWVCLDCELMPWSAKAQQLIDRQYAPVAQASIDALSHARAALETAARRLPELAPLVDRYAVRVEAATKYREAYQRYCWPAKALNDFKLAPFHLLASEGAVHTSRDHAWHMEIVGKIADACPNLVIRTPYRVVDTTSEESLRQAVDRWESLTAAGGEGFVVKPFEFTVQSGHHLVQPAVKCRGKEYLRIIYGPEYDSAVSLPLLRQRSLGAKRSLAEREFALGVEALERFVRREPLRRVHECVFAVLALESEPVDPRL